MRKLFFEKFQFLLYHYADSSLILGWDISTSSKDDDWAAGTEHVEAVPLLLHRGQGLLLLHFDFDSSQLTQAGNNRSR